MRSFGASARSRAIALGVITDRHDLDHAPCWPHVASRKHRLLGNGALPSWAVDATEEGAPTRLPLACVTWPLRHRTRVARRRAPWANSNDQRLVVPRRNTHITR